MTIADTPIVQNDMTPELARAALAWLMAMGADEIVGEEAVDRFAIPAPQVAVPQRSPPAPSQVPKAITAKVGDHVNAAPANACSSIAELEASLQQLENFPLKRTASNLCFAGGKLDAPVMIIGDVPGRDEDIEGQVFAGHNAVLLDKMLRAIGLSLESVSLFNFIPWRPPGNRAVTEPEIAICQPYLLRAIELCAPRHILSLGQLPMQRLLGRKDSLMAARGKWFELDVQTRKIPLLASFHPSYLSLQASQKRLAWRDLLTFKEVLHD